MPRQGGTGGGRVQTYTVPELADLWVSAGGARFAMVDAVAVALAESGGNPAAVSPSHDYGLWQINAVHFGEYGINASNWSDPAVNARAAVAISGRGANWGPWCTAWADPARDCGRRALADPQKGSAAYPHIAWVRLVLGVVSTLPGGAPPPTSGRDAVANSWGYVQKTAGSWASGWQNRAQALTRSIRAF